MATPRKKTNKAKSKHAPKPTAQAKKPAATAGAASRKSSAAKAGPAAPPARDRLKAVKPSGGRDDSFFDLVHEVARQIPKGRVTSYGAIAAALGTKLSSRMVGWAMLSAHHANPPVPAHRVVNRNGLLSGRHHYNPPERMQQLLEKEGVRVKDSVVVDFARLFWDPVKEL